MHHTALLDLGTRPDATKVSFDISNAHNELERADMVAAVQADVPDLLPWVLTGVLSDTTHMYRGIDGQVCPFGTDCWHRASTPGHP